MIERDVILVRQVGGFLCPERFGRVDDLVFVRIGHLAVFPFLFLAGNDRNGKEPAIFSEQRVNPSLFKELGVLGIDMKYDVRTAISLFGSLHREFGRTVAGPADSLGTLLITQRENLDFVCNHKG